MESFREIRTTTEEVKKPLQGEADLHLGIQHEGRRSVIIMQLKEAIIKRNRVFEECLFEPRRFFGGVLLFQTVRRLGFT